MPGPHDESRTVLVVEDEELLRLLGAEMFSVAGFHVVEAGNAQQALGLLRALAAIHLVFTDVAMPGPMDGLALAHHVSQRWPHIGVIIVSGQGFPDLDLPRGARFHVKPYDPELVLHHARELTGVE
jgi:CheY-like chemotaxis protein